MADYPTTHAARAWLAEHNDDSRRELVLLSVGYAALAIGAAAVAVYLLTVFTGVVFGVVGLAVFAIACIPLNVRLGQDPLVSGSTNLNRGGFSRSRTNMTLFEFLAELARIIFPILMLPLSAPREIMQNMRKRKRLAEMDTESVSAVLAELVERRAGVPVDELTLKLGLEDPLSTREQLSDVRGVVFLEEPDRVTLTETVQHEIFACGRDHVPQPQ